MSDESLDVHLGAAAKTRNKRKQAYLSNQPADGTGAGLRSGSGRGAFESDWAAVGHRGAVAGRGRCSLGIDSGSQIAGVTVDRS